MAKKKSKALPFIIGAVVVGGVLLIPVIINKLRPGGTVPGYEPLQAAQSTNGGVPQYAHLAPTVTGSPTRGGSGTFLNL